MDSRRFVEKVLFRLARSPQMLGTRITARLGACRYAW